MFKIMYIVLNQNKQTNLSLNAITNDIPDGSSLEQILITGLPSSVSVVCCASVIVVSVYRSSLTEGETWA